MSHTRSLLSTTNRKLGTEIASWSISRTSCIGRTRYCDKYCYGKRGNLNFPKCKAGREWRYEQSKSENFANDMIGEIRSHEYKVIRVHVVGDFYSPEYINKWYHIATICSSTTFYAYTRAWRYEHMLPFLDMLRRLPNFVLYASTDECTGEAPEAWLKANVDATNHMGYKECTSKCEICDWCYTGKGNVFFRTRIAGKHYLKG